MAPEDGAAPPPRKVRSACRRCRQKRVKCDGGIPACSNCTRAQVPCIDVHTGNNELSIPRDFAIRCCARIKWLEQQLISACPDFDLSQGPQVNAEFVETLHAPQDGLGPIDASSSMRNNPSDFTMHDNVSEESTAPKRSHSAMESDVGSPLSVNARSVAIDLGMLSLQSDSRQKHYLGSSSGLFFTKLMGLDNELRPAQAALQARRLAPLRISDEIYRSLYEKLRQELPSPEHACLLFEVYFENVYLDQPFLHPKSLLNAYHALYVCSQQGYGGSVDRNGWIDSVDPFSYNGRFDLLAGRNTTPITISTAVFHVFMVLSLAATILTRKKNFDHSPTRFHRMAMSTASETFSNISISSLQAVLLLAVQSLIEPAGVNIWTLTHLAMSHCIDLGLHREPADCEMASAATTIFRFIFYTVYSLDRSIATIQGRPLGIRDETFDIQPPSEADILEMTTMADDGLMLRLPASQFVSLSICRFHLERHISEIKLLLYHLPTRSQSFVWPSDIEAIQARIKSDLDNWLADVHRIVPTDDMETEEKVKLKYEKMRQEQFYHSAMTLLFQPSQMFPSPNQHALSICYQSCSRRLQIYDVIGSQDMLYYNWRNIHGIFSSGATIVYCAWVSRDLQRTIPFAKLLRDLRTCSNHLSIGSQWWPSVRNGKESFEMMIDMIIKYFSDMQLQKPPLPPPSHRHWISNVQGDPRNHLVPGGQSETDMDASGLDLPSNNHQMHSIGLTNPGFQSQANLMNAGTGAQPPFNNSVDFGMPMDPMQELENAPSIEAAMENFMAEYLHEDWGWDPFSGSIAFDGNDPRLS